LIYLPILNLKSALLQSRSAFRAVCLQDPRSSLREGRDSAVIRTTSLFSRRFQPTSIHPIMIARMRRSRSPQHIYASWYVNLFL